MGDTIPDGGVQPAPERPSTAQPVTELAAPGVGGPVWGRTIIDDAGEQFEVFAAFRVVAGSGTGRLFDLRSKGDTRFGRDAALNDIVLNDPKCSAQQLIIRSDGEEFGVIDLGSANGTFVNGEKVLAPVALKQNDRLRVGDIVMVFHLAKAKEDAPE